MECRVGVGNTKEERETAVMTGDGLSLGVSEGVARLVEASGSRVGSRLDTDCSADGFLTNCPDESLGGCFGMWKVTKGDRKVGRWVGRTEVVMIIHNNYASLGQPGECARKRMHEISWAKSVGFWRLKVRDFAGSRVVMLCEDNQDQRGKSVSERGSVSRSDKRRRERCVGKGGWTGQVRTRGRSNQSTR
jgi:hypothetical protein